MGQSHRTIGSLTGQQTNRSRAFGETAKMSLGIPNMSTPIPSRRKVPVIKESDSSEEEDDTAMQMMVMAQMMRKQPQEDDEQTRLLKDLQTQNAQILQLKEHFAKNGSPYASQMTQRIEYLERMLLESDKKGKQQQTGYFFNQMLMMMMMNPSKRPSCQTFLTILRCFSCCR